ncbi:MAG TPA: glycosyltransferase [Candidatus Binatus sp.]|nr:glycosyltransferase [Candidatus Binatus sp.]
MADSPAGVSVVVPTYSRPRELTVCLRALASLRYPRSRLEVIVVDDGNAEPVEPVVAAARALLDVTLVRQPHAGPARARNEGARRAAGDLVAFTDDDCAPSPDWLAALTGRAARSPGNAVGGRTVNASPRNSYATATTLLVDYLVDRYNAAPEQARFLPSCNLLVPAARFREVGGFDGSFAFPGGEDREFCERWRRSGFEMSWAPEAVVHHTPAARLGPFLRQHFNYGRGASRLQRAGLRANGRAAPGEPLSFYVDLLRQPFSVVPRRRAMRLTALLLVCQLATAAGYLRDRAW